MGDHPVKVIIWAVPRSVSSTLLKCLSGFPNAKIFYELYSVAYFFGPERIDTTFLTADPPSPTNDNGHDLDQSQFQEGYKFSSSICTYEWVKSILDEDYPSKKVIISKEIAHCIHRKYDSLPAGYRHVFLLRHPSKVFPSWKKLGHEAMTDVLKTTDKPPSSLDEHASDIKGQEGLPTWMAFKEMYDLFEHVKEKQLDVDPVIIDADDLVSNPAAILSTLCAKLGIPYSDSLLTWEKGMATVDTWTLGKHFNALIRDSAGFENFRNSTSFQRWEPDKHTTAGHGEVESSPDINHSIDMSMPFYAQMYEQRMKVADAR